MDNEKEEIKDRIITRSIKAIPNWAWALCGSYALFMATNLFFIKFAEIDLDKHVNRYFEIWLNEIESKRCDVPSIDESKMLVLINNNKVNIEHLTKNSHPPRKKP